MWLCMNSRPVSIESTDWTVSNSHQVYQKSNFVYCRMANTNIVNLSTAIHGNPNTRAAFFVIKPTRCTYFTNLFCHETLHVSDSSSIIRSLFTVHSTLVYVIQLSSRSRMELQFHPGPARKLSINLYDIYQCQVYSE